jgi:CheY-like chemotaxis protein
METKTSAVTILVVEDSPDCSTTLEIALGSLNGVEIALAGSAEEALRAIERGGISAVVTDLHLPSMDGLELLARLRADARHSHLPIVIISGDADPRTPERAMGSGATAYFAKPYSPGAVRRTLEELIHAR